MIAYLALMALVLARLLRSRFGKPKTVSSQVAGKQTVEYYSRTAPGGKRTRYAVSFLVNGKKKSFYVSEFSWNGYREGERGTLTYQGDRLIEFC